MDRAGLTPAYAVQVRHRDDQHALETTELQDPEVMVRQILEARPQVVTMLPPTESRGQDGHAPQKSCRKVTVKVTDV
jgi:hypothetical protein